MTAPADEDLEAIHQALIKDHIYIDPALESKFTDEQVSAIKANIAEYEHPVFVVAYPLATTDTFSGSAADLLTRLHAAYPEPGIYLSTTKDFEVGKYNDIHLEGRVWDVPGVSGGEFYHDALSTVRYEPHETVGAAFERATDLLLVSPAKLSTTMEGARQEWRDREGVESSSTGSSPDSDDGFDPTGLVVAGVVVAVVCAVAWRALAGVRKAKKPQALPPSAMARIRKANDRKLEKQARDEVLALGELIDVSEITSRGDTDSWQAALDHYEAARRVLSGETSDVLDVVGAIVLADNGSRALDAALAGRSFTPPTRCFLNPLHGSGSHRQSVTYSGEEVKAPLCTDCRNALKKDRAPDILDVARRGKPVHYFETDSEPWASTGYGSLESDLITKLQTRP